jgi:hypothetical protein
MEDHASPRSGERPICSHFRHHSANRKPKRQMNGLFTLSFGALS